ncbi:hypothetical protein D3C86_1782970 [compost metagenome]
MRGLLAQRQGFHQHRQLVFQPAPEPCRQRVLRTDVPGASGQRPTEGQVRFGVLFEEGAGRGIQFRQAIEQLLQGIAHLPAFLVQLAGFPARTMLLTTL